MQQCFTIPWYLPWTRIECLKQKTREFYTTPHLMTNMSEAVKECLAILECHRNIQRRAIVLDIDGTAIFHSMTPQGVELEVVRNEFIYQVYTRALELGFKVFFVTARIDLITETAAVGRRKKKSVEPATTVFCNHENTIQELHRAQFSQFEGVYMRNASYEQDPCYSLYKWECRGLIEAQGYVIVLNAGDQWADSMKLEPWIATDQERTNFSSTQSFKDTDIVLGHYPGNHTLFSLKLPAEELNQVAAGRPLQNYC
jgi:hypothetical protein